MNLRLILGTLEEKLTSPARLLLIVMFLVFPIFGAYLGGADPTTDGLIMVYVLTLGVGIIGADVSAGVLQLIFTRPIKRSSYVLSRWLGLVVGVMTVYAVQIILMGGMLLFGGHSLPDVNYGSHVIEALLLAMGMSAVIVFFSAIFVGYGDGRSILVLWLLRGICQFFEKTRFYPKVFSVVGSQINGVLWPSLDVNLVLHGEPYDWLLIVPYVAVLIASLVFAIFIMNRKELSYAAS